MPSNDDARRRQSSMLPLAAPARSMPACRLVSKIRTRRSGSGYGSGWSTMPFTRANRIVLTPMPTPMVADRQQRHTGRTAQDPCGVDQLSRELLERESGAAFRNLLARGCRRCRARAAPAAGPRPRRCRPRPCAPPASRRDARALRPTRDRAGVAARPPARGATVPSWRHSASAWSTRIMAATVRSHAFWPVERRRRPAAVSV